MSSHRAPRLGGVRASDGERGATIVLATAAMVPLLIVTAIVVDLGFVRATRREAQKQVDLAALSAGAELSSVDGADPRQACRDAVTYLHLNTGALPDSTSVPCDSLPTTCDDSTEKVTVTDGGTAAPYTISISYPVPDEDIVDDDVPGGLRSEDGQPCERLGLEVTRTSPSFFASIMGQSELEIHASAVVRRKPVEEARVPNLWLLEPFGCAVLNASGGSSISVGTATASGLITIDSDGTGPDSCSSSNDYVIDVNGAGSLIEAIPDDLDPPGEISLVAMLEGQTDCTDGNDRACDQADADALTLTPIPTRRPNRATRSFVDWVYNCKDDYPDYAGDGGSIPIIDCPDADELPDYVDLLIGTNGSTTGGYANVGAAPAGSWTTIGSGGQCNSTSLPAAIAGNVYFNCSLNVRDLLNITGGNVIVNGGVAVGNGGALVINGTAATVTGAVISSNPTPDLPGVCALPEGTFVASSCYQASSQDAAWMVVRGQGGAQASSGGRLVLNHAAMLMRSSANNNTLRTGSGGTMEWTSPEEGPFRGLSLWGERYDANNWNLSGGGNLSLEGVFFTPEADPFRMNGGSALTPQEAQFISRSLSIEGGTNLDLSPAGLKLIQIPPPAAFLIR